MYGAILQGEPSAVDVGGSPVRIRAGFRTGLRAEGIDRRDPWGQTRLLWLWYGDAGRRALPPAVAADPWGALSAGCAWHDRAWEALPYGGGGPGAGRARAFDWEADAAIVCADFRRLYGIDLADAGTRLHWHTFCALTLSAARTRGSLLGEALSARTYRGPDPGGERRAAARAWALPPAEEEIAMAALARF